MGTGRARAPCPGRPLTPAPSTQHSGVVWVGTCTPSARHLIELDTRLSLVLTADPGLERRTRTSLPTCASQEGPIAKTGNGGARQLPTEAAWYHGPRYCHGADLRRRWDQVSVGAGPRTADEPATARPLGRVRPASQAAGSGEHSDRPRTRRLVLVTGCARCARSVT